MAEERKIRRARLGPSKKCWIVWKKTSVLISIESSLETRGLNDFSGQSLAGKDSHWYLYEWIRGYIRFLRSKKKKLKKLEKNFIIDATTFSSNLGNYNSLTDPSLKTYFKSPDVHKLLKNTKQVGFRPLKVWFLIDR